MIILSLLIAINLLILLKTSDPGEFKIVKEKYKILREYLINTNEYPEFAVLTRCMVLNGYYRTTSISDVGYNTNKGQEIGICLSGTPNEIFHVLLHELAHCTVTEYDHSEQFWNNYMKLRDLAISIGIYEKIPEKTAFCGKHVQDK